MIKHVLYTVVLPITFVSIVIFFATIIVAAYQESICITHMARTDLNSHFSYAICDTSKGREVVGIEYNRVVEEQHRLMEEWLEERK